MKRNEMYRAFHPAPLAITKSLARPLQMGYLLPSMQAIRHDKHFISSGLHTLNAFCGIRPKYR